MMKRLIAWMGGIFLVSGLVLILIVLAGQHQTDRIQEDLIDSLKHVKAASAEPAQLSQMDSNPSEQPQMERSSQTEPEQGTDGVLYIPSIHLEAAVVEGVSRKELSYALGKTGYGNPGERDAHSVIAGHNAGIKSGFFQRLNEVKKGEIFSYETREGVLKYKVIKIEVVRPDQIDRVNPVSGQSLMTLVTCYPERSNQYRLLVTGLLVEEPLTENQI